MENKKNQYGDMPQIRNYTFNFGRSIQRRTVCYV